MKSIIEAAEQTIDDLAQVSLEIARVLATHNRTLPPLIVARALVALSECRSTVANVLNSIEAAAASRT